MNNNFLVTITDTNRKWYYRTEAGKGNGALILTYYYDSGFNIEDCILCWYYLSHTNVVKGYTSFYNEKFRNGMWKYHNYYISKLDINITDNILYTPCNIAMYKYDPMADGNVTACAKSYYDIYRFFSTHTQLDLITRDGKKLGYLEKCETLINNIPYYECGDLYNKPTNLGLRIDNIYKSRYHDEFTGTIMDCDEIVLTFGVPR
jgi:hypothetical protein